MESTKFTEYCSNMSFHSGLVLVKSILLIQPSTVAELCFFHSLLTHLKNN